MWRRGHHERCPCSVLRTVISLECNTFQSENPTSKKENDFRNVFTNQTRSRMASEKWTDMWQNCQFCVVDWEPTQLFFASWCCIFDWLACSFTSRVCQNQTQECLCIHSLQLVLKCLRTLNQFFDEECLSNITCVSNALGWLALLPKREQFLSTSAPFRRENSPVPALRFGLLSRLYSRAKDPRNRAKKEPLTKHFTQHTMRCVVCVGGGVPHEILVSLVSAQIGRQNNRHADAGNLFHKTAPNFLSFPTNWGKSQIQPSHTYHDSRAVCCTRMFHCLLERNLTSCDFAMLGNVYWQRQSHLRFSRPQVRLHCAHLGSSA